MNSLKRPGSILFFSLLLILTPLVTVILNAYINMIPLWGRGNIFTRLAISDIIILCLYPIAAIAVYTVHKAGWWVFMVTAATMIVYNITAYAANPMISLGGMIMFNLVLFAAAGFFFRKHIIAPYFNPRLRWWEQARRYEIDLGVSIEYAGMAELGYLEDISLGGCFIRIAEKIDTGHIYPLRIYMGNSISVALKGRVMRSVLDDCSLPGYGIMFVNISETEKEGVEHIIAMLHLLGVGAITEVESAEEKRLYSRYSVNINVSLRFQGNINPAKLVNVSSTGACLETSLDIKMGELCGFFCTVGYDSADIDGVVKWKKKVKDFYHYGLLFINMNSEQRKQVAALLKTIRKLGGRARKRDLELYDKMVENTLPETPYRIFHRHKDDSDKKS